ncbi:NAD(P)/FAD-dependent oxidoreductase [Limimaricola pyoseonensis]|uniref:Gamma-glutamylputrescine oxidase n=1 Tax=Limimaricola pyoseonensis TaxID=521013 RepID=A0A1G7CPP7_9RHOB|nr:FAD-binding oxidoreductase [Limimaricola pyoseonensis]SDE41289.1 gamma-glutamylputrescine oxidase [Limimaricola pyoseonensis]
MNPLYRNDRPGQMPRSWYVASGGPAEERAALEGERRCDVAIVGAGFTGLWAALTAARAGLDVVVLDAHRAGFGASGRNGGQVGSGFNKGQLWLEQRLGESPARQLWDLAEEAKRQLRDFCAEHAPEARYLPGVVHGAYSEKEAAGDRAEAEHLSRAYGYDAVRPLGRDEIRGIVRTDAYHGGTYDSGAGHLHPLRYARALARAAEAAGATIHELTEVTKVEPGQPAVLHTPGGRVTADHVILAGNGYLPGIMPEVAERVMPINSFIAATEPLGERWREVLAEDIAVADSRFVVNYYRMTEDRRFLFGGRESYSIGFPTDITTKLRQRMEELFPQLKGTRIDNVWGGTLGITMTRLPALQRIGPNILSGAGFSGHGVALSGMAGKVMAEAVAGQAGRFDTFSRLPVPSFPGGARYRAPLLTLAMTWFSLRDRLGI